MRELLSAIIVVTHIILPIWFIYWLYRERKANWARWFSVVALTAVYVVMMYLGGAAWDWVGSYWPTVFLCGYAVVLIWTLSARKSLPLWPEKTFKSWLSVVLFVAAAIYLSLDFSQFTNTRQFNKDASVALYFPLKNGRFDIRQGGSSEALNHHFKIPAQRFALDIVKLNKIRTRASGLFPAENEKYEIFAESLYAPCDGDVVDSRSELADMIPPEGDPENLLGNFISLYCAADDVTVLLAHLKQNTLAVKTGEQVVAGQLVAQVGNTGNTSEPHLHLQAVKGRQTDIETLAYKGQGIPMTFDGRFLIRGDIISKE